MPPSHGLPATLQPSATTHRTQPHISFSCQLPFFEPTFGVVILHPKVAVHAVPLPRSMSFDGILFSRAEHEPESVLCHPCPLLPAAPCSSILAAGPRLGFPTSLHTPTGRCPAQVTVGPSQIIYTSIPYATSRTLTHPIYEPYLGQRLHCHLSTYYRARFSQVNRGCALSACRITPLHLRDSQSQLRPRPDMVDTTEASWVSRGQFCTTILTAHTPICMLHMHLFKEINVCGLPVTYARNAPHRPALI
ncbi:hypothetical protein CORC01_01886 [Colletotrichum orchidophilum]|uniref:Uncharacterized protein n=1 Tax=Colletotrichum orchidophilum TaxID=1209926 RepID=A0A1G4BN78_9PEZI|nr:uncharacterized protein CORC01_01886 [Colletotrichum orchidophilum]OHF02785.1 hypothetical protein CORC01_01886 [Colletotrichum orchidophilum]